MENIFGGLIEFNTQKDFDNFVESLDKESAIKILEVGINYALSNGLYSMGETFCLYKCISKLKENENNIEADSLRDDDNHGDSN
jgi:hypothetical protein